MPREPANPFGAYLTETAILVETAEPLPGGGVLWVFAYWDPCWWEKSANDDKAEQA